MPAGTSHGSTASWKSNTRDASTQPTAIAPADASAPASADHDELRALHRVDLRARRAARSSAASRTRRRACRRRRVQHEHAGREREHEQELHCADHLQHHPLQLREIGATSIAVRFG